ncbi:hypothetical protein AOQ89_02860 [bacterium endosymbiont of Pedicinus badii]|nr:hypothetical protein [bacterium endosymbiont of Pedicinus badii]OQM34246.1 hypothetical protein AOQ89_02860 [bacterium endosymbiont of Pedicinus badii]
MKIENRILRNNSWLEKNPKVLRGIKRGIEREALRTTQNGILSNKKHPKQFGSPLTNKYITTDFAESLLEIVTPAVQNTKTLVRILKDIHIYIVKRLQKESLWPVSMPCFIKKNSIKIAEYGKSNIGIVKNLYRKGLKNRYGSFMQVISGIHYNFSFSREFWESYAVVKKKKK